MVYQAVKSLWKLKSSNSKGFKNMFVHQNSEIPQQDTVRSKPLWMKYMHMHNSLDARGVFSPPPEDSEKL